MARQAKSSIKKQNLLNYLNFDSKSLTLRCPNFIGVHVPVAPDLAKTVKVTSDHSKNLAKVLGGAKNGKFS